MGVRRTAVGAALLGLALGCGTRAPDPPGSADDSAARVDDSDTNPHVDDSTAIVDEDGDGESPPEDCDDNDASVHPSADEYCGNGIDDDCDSVVDGCVLPVEVAARVSIETGIDYGPYGAALDFDTAGLLWICTGGEESKERWGTVTALEGSNWPARSILGSDQAIVEAIDASGDADGDGLSDLFIAGGDEASWDASAWIWSSPVVGTGLDVVDADVLIVGAGQGYFSKPEAIGDVNADGHGDWFVVGSAPWLIEGPLSGVVAVPDDARVQPAVAGTFVALGADVDADGVDDFVSAGPLSDGTGMGALHVFLGPLDGAPSGEAADHYFEGRALGYSVAAGDFDDDGSNELVVGGGVSGNSRLFVLASPPAATSSLIDASVAQIEGRELDGAVGFALAAADFDGDGAADIIEGTLTDLDTKLYDGELTIVRGPFSGVLAIEDVASVIVEGEENGRMPGNGLAVGDLDGDKVLEVAAESFLWNGANTDVVGAHIHVITPAWLVAP